MHRTARPSGVRAGVTSAVTSSGVRFAAMIRASSFWMRAVRVLQLADQLGANLGAYV
jgi:hypothetical protein